MKLWPYLMKFKERYTIILVTHEEDIAQHAHRIIRLEMELLKVTL